MTARTKKKDKNDIIAVVKVLMELGLPDPVSSFIRDMDKEYNHPEREINLRSISVPITQSHSPYPAVDLSAIAPNKILQVMFNAAWEQGYKEGQQAAEANQAAALLDAFPRLKDTIMDLAETVANKKIDQIRESLRE